MSKPDKYIFAKTSVSNPFVTDMTIETKKTKELVQRGVLFDENGKEIGTELEKIEFIDKEEFVKIFARWLPEFFEMTTPGFKVWVYIATILQVGKDEVYIHNFEAAETTITDLKGRSCVLSRTTLHRGVKNLIDLKFIAKHSGRGAGWYFINPSAFFMGDRVKFAKTYALKGLASPKVKVKNSLTGKTEILGMKELSGQ